MDTLWDWLEESLKPYFSPLWDSTDFWRIAAIVLAMLLVGSFTLRDKIFEFFESKERKEHDKKLFKSQSNFISVAEMRETLTMLNDIPVERFDKIEAFFSHAIKPESAFLNGKVNRTFARYLLSLREYIFYINENFRPDGRDQYSRIDCERGTKEYDAKRDEFMMICQGCYTSLDKFRETVKEKLIL